MTSSLAIWRPAEILLVDDDDNDVELTRLAFERASLKVNLHRVENGVECLAFLRKEGPYAGVPTPDLVLQDLNMPIMGGREVLARIRADDELKHLPIVVLTTSGADRDVLETYQASANSYIQKPVDFQQFQKVVQGLSDYWFTVVVLPTPDSE